MKRPIESNKYQNLTVGTKLAHELIPFDNSEMSRVRCIANLVLHQYDRRAVNEIGANDAHKVVERERPFHIAIWQEEYVEMIFDIENKSGPQLTEIFERRRMFLAVSNG